ncbi:FMN-binding protein [Halorhodospira halochloris]|uniref:FMN-binding protein n=1 Tax=Halorhodospira halochloris TaxID=1052 RepID=UPI001EE79481|nr:FMN-binding protein [Halorhodospira halochloris]MCG5547639.1 FMN-binding protein [Halorhodospira halochloris]
MTEQNGTNQTTSQPAPTSSAKLIATLGTIAFLSGLLVVTVVESTREAIEENHRIALERAVFDVIPGAEKQRTFIVTDDGLVDADKNDVDGQEIYAGYDADGVLQGVAIEASGRGYEGEIRLLYGYQRENEKIVGMTILESRETPGLGDRIETDERFLASFDELQAALDDAGKGLAHEIVTVSPSEADQPGEIDGITGATVSAEAVGKIINSSANELLPSIAPHWADMEREQ